MSRVYVVLPDGRENFNHEYGGSVGVATTYELACSLALDYMKSQNDPKHVVHGGDVRAMNRDRRKQGDAYAFGLYAFGSYAHLIQASIQEHDLLGTIADDGTGSRQKGGAQ